MGPCAFGMCDALEITRKHCTQRHRAGVFADSSDARARGIVTFSHLFESDGELRAPVSCRAGEIHFLHAFVLHDVYGCIRCGAPLHSPTLLGVCLCVCWRARGE